MKITQLLCIVACVHCLAGCIVTGKQKVSLTFKDRHTLKPVAGMKVRLEWSDERPWRFANPNTREGFTDTQGMVTFGRLAEQYWQIKAYRPGRQVGTYGFGIDTTHGVRFDCGYSRGLIESNRLLIKRDRWSPLGPAPNMVMTAREIRPDGTEKNAVASVLRGKGFSGYERIELRSE
jgi:hypothetical protein